MIDEKLNSKILNKNDVIHMNNLEFDITLDELKNLMQSKSNEAKEIILRNYGCIDILVNKLKSDVQSGITGDDIEIEKRVKKFGKNEIPPKSPKSIFLLAIEALEDTTLIMLMICSIVSICLSFYHPKGSIHDEEYFDHSGEETNMEWIEGVAILIAVIIVVFVTAFNDWRKEQQFRRLKNKIEKGNLLIIFYSIF